MLSFRTWELSSWNKSTEINHPICIITCRSMCAKASNVLSYIWRQTKKWTINLWCSCAGGGGDGIGTGDVAFFNTCLSLHLSRCVLFVVHHAVQLSCLLSHTCYVPLATPYFTYVHKKHSFCCIQMIYNVGCTLRVSLITNNNFDKSFYK